LGKEFLRILKKINIAIDGYSSCGKSTLAKDLARELNYKYIDSGAMYRAVTLFLIRENIDIANHTDVANRLEDINIYFEYKDGAPITHLNGISVENEIRKMHVASCVSHVAVISAVRKKLVSQQQFLGKDKGVVMDGRDISTVVFPDAELKIFVTAEIDIRADRRFQELESKGIDGNLEDIKSNLRDRDFIDSTREDSPLTQTEDAILLDNSNLDRESQLRKALEWAQEKIELTNTLGSL